jgi:hypothetical protein
MTMKTVYCDEWIQVRALMNKHFSADRPCSICRRLTCATVWYNIRSDEVRCFRCFDAAAEHWEREI